MTNKPVGLLWDSVSNNSGDIAIGMVLQRFCETREIPFRVVDPFNFHPRDYSTFIIGGGQILRTYYDFFYHSFNVPGPHILNSVGIHMPDNLDFLREYRLVSVRSKAEKTEIARAYPDLEIEVHPCTTVLFDQFYAAELEQARRGTQGGDEWVGVHLNNTTLRKLPRLFPALEQLNRECRLMFIPFTHYENDRFLMETLSRWLPGSRVSPANDVVSVFAEIGSLKALVSSSMHAAMFAYLQNVPALAFPQDHKLRYFFEERGFPQCLYTSAESLLPNLRSLLANPPDYSSSAAADRADVEKHLDHIHRLVLEDAPYEYSDDAEYTNRSFNEMRRSMYAFYRQESFERNTLSTQLLDQRLITRSLVKGESDLVSPIERKGVRQGRLWKWIAARRGAARQTRLTRSPEYELVSSCGLFDARWYLQHNPDVAAAQADPVLHFLQHGGIEGRDPGPSFSSREYLDAYPDVRATGVNPLIHYLKSRQGN